MTVSFLLLQKTMSGYTIDNIINECLDEKINTKGTSRGKTIGAKIEIYQNSWAALNSWIETKIAKQMVTIILNNRSLIL